MIQGDLTNKNLVSSPGLHRYDECKPNILSVSDASVTKKALISVRAFFVTGLLLPSGRTTARRATAAGAKPLLLAIKIGGNTADHLVTGL